MQQKPFDNQAALGWKPNYVCSKVSLIEFSGICSQVCIGLQPYVRKEGISGKATVKNVCLKTILMNVVISGYEHSPLHVYSEGLTPRKVCRELQAIYQVAGLFTGEER